MDREKNAQDAVADVLLIFARLFDGPPPSAIAAVLVNDTLPKIRDLLGLEQLHPPLAQEMFAAEYEPLFLLPTSTAVTPYLSQYLDPGAENDLPIKISTLSTATGISWQKESFIAGRAYPVFPDHLNCVFMFLAYLVSVDRSAEIAGVNAGEWLAVLLNMVTVGMARLCGHLYTLKVLYPAYNEAALLAWQYAHALNVL